MKDQTKLILQQFLDEAVISLDSISKEVGPLHEQQRIDMLDNISNALTMNQHNCFLINHQTKRISFFDPEDDHFVEEEWRKATHKEVQAYFEEVLGVLNAEVETHRVDRVRFIDQIEELKNTTNSQHKALRKEQELNEIAINFISHKGKDDEFEDYKKDWDSGLIDIADQIIQLQKPTPESILRILRDANVNGR